MISDESIFGKAGKSTATPVEVAAAVAAHSKYEPDRILLDTWADFAGIHPIALANAVVAGLVSWKPWTSGWCYRVSAHVPESEWDDWFTGEDSVLNP